MLATDGSDHSEGAAEFLTCLSLSSEDEITIFHATYLVPCLYGQESYHDNLKAIKKEIAPRILDSVLDILKPLNSKISTLILDGSPEYCIMDVSVESGADLVVMGARGIRGIDPLLIGNVTRAVAIKSSKPVLIIKLPVPEKSDRIKILFATDGSAHSAATSGILSAMPFPESTEITVLNVIPWEILDMPKTFVPEINERYSEIIEKTRSNMLIESKRIIDQAKEYLSKKFTHISVLSKVGESSTEIIRASEEFDSDMIAIGCRGLRGIKGMMGSVSRNILTNSKCSVLIGKTFRD